MERLPFFQREMRLGGAEHGHGPIRPPQPDEMAPIRDRQDRAFRLEADRLIEDGGQRGRVSFPVIQRMPKRMTLSILSHTGSRVTLRTLKLVDWRGEGYSDGWLKGYRMGR